jgi:hypothetical protein
MKKIAISAQYYASKNFVIERPELDWQKMKDALGRVLNLYNDFVNQNPDAKDPEGNYYRKLAVSMEATAKQILWVFMQKFSKGEIKGTVLKLTRGYLAESIGIGYRAPHEVTIQRHIDRFITMPYKILTERGQATLGLPGNNTNCISLSLARNLIFFKSAKHQALHEQGTELLKSPRPITYKAGESKQQGIIPVQMSFKPTSRPTIAYRKTEPPVSRREQPQAGFLGDLLLNFFPGQH